MDPTTANLCRVLERGVMFPLLVKVLVGAEEKHYTAVSILCTIFVVEVVSDPSEEDIKALRDWTSRQRRLFQEAASEASFEGQNNHDPEPGSVTATKKRKA